MSEGAQKRVLQLLWMAREILSTGAPLRKGSLWANELHAVLAQMEEGSKP